MRPLPIFLVAVAFSASGATAGAAKRAADPWQSEFQLAHEKIADFYSFSWAGRNPAKTPWICGPEHTTDCMDPAALPPRNAVLHRAALLPEQVIPLITSGIRDYLTDNRTVSIDDLTVAIARTLTPPYNGKYMNSMSDVDGSVSIAFSTRLNAYAVGYVVGTCAICGDSWIGIFQQDKSGWTLKGQNYSARADQTMNLAFVGSGDRLLLLQYGILFGNPGRALIAHLYSLDQGIRQVWALTGQYEGEVSVAGDRLTVKSLTGPALPDSHNREKVQVFDIADGSVRLLSTKLSAPPQ